MLVDLEFRVLVFVEGGKPEKNPRSKARPNNKLNPHMASSRNRTWTTLVGGERSHHCASLLPKGMGGAFNFFGRRWATLKKVSCKHTCQQKIHAHDHCRKKILVRSVCRKNSCYTEKKYYEYTGPEKNS